MGLGRGEVQEILARFDLSPSRALGQNFLADPNIALKISRLASLDVDDCVVEVGPGIGSLTLTLAEKVARVIAIELDRHVIPALGHVLSNAGLTNVTVIQGDAMKTDFDAIIGPRSEGKLVANLPYNISVPLILMILEEHSKITEMVVMVQKEVGERLCATSGGSTFSQAALKLGYFATAKIVAPVSRQVFIPRPNVDSVLVHIVRRAAVELDLDQVTYDLVFQLARRAFGNKRQMLRRTLASMATARDFEDAAIDPTRRPEELTIDDWKTLARNLIFKG